MGFTTEGGSGTMEAMAAEPEHPLVHVTLSGGRSGEYVITEERPGGKLTLVPDTSWEARLARHGERHMTLEEFDAFMAEHGPHMGPPDGEG
jgi:hypothetical protein